MAVANFCVSLMLVMGVGVVSSCLVHPPRSSPALRIIVREVNLFDILSPVLVSRVSINYL